MVESTVYFEAYRHILEGLKEVDPQHLPLQVILKQSLKQLLTAEWLLISQTFAGQR